MRVSGVKMGLLSLRTSVALALFCVASSSAAAPLERLRGWMRPEEELVGYIEACGRGDNHVLLADSSSESGVSSRVVVVPPGGSPASFKVDEALERITCEGDFVVAIGESGSAFSFVILNLRDAQVRESLRDRSSLAPVFLRRRDDVFVAVAREMSLTDEQPSSAQMYKLDPKSGRFEQTARVKWSQVGRFGVRY